MIPAVRSNWGWAHALLGILFTTSAAARPSTAEPHLPWILLALAE